MTYQSEDQLLAEALEEQPDLLDQFNATRHSRSSRRQLQTLIVEDQIFSRKLMHDFLYKFSSVESSNNIKGGLQLYLKLAPNLAFLDVELIEDNGHMLACLLKRLDPEAYIVMVTSHRSIDDVTAAKLNQIDGYILKPCSRQNIVACLNRYLTIHPQSYCRRIEA